MDQTVFESYRDLLFAVAYRMLGSASEAEDVVQDAYLRAAEAGPARDPKAFLVTVATRLAIDRLRSARHRRETYVGPWLPEPLLGEVPDPGDELERADSLSLAFMVLLEALTPSERAAFLLKEVFGFSYREVAAAIERTEPATRQLVHRARRSLAGRRARFEVSREQHRDLLNRFLEACSGGDVDGLAALLAEDAVSYTDGGGEIRAARRPIVGRDKVARFLVGLAKKTPSGTTVEIVAVNGRPGVLLGGEGVPLAVIDLETGEGSIERVYVVVAPSKLRAPVAS